MSNLKRICLLSTGGTISMVKNSDGMLVPSHESSNLVDAVPTLKQIAEVTHISLGEFDSANVQPHFWVTLAQTVYDHYDHFDGFVIAHGTDTLAYTASALSFFLQELGKPIVITGAQVPLSEYSTDGVFNLVNAFRVATADIAEVCVVFGSNIIRGTKARKTSAFHLEAFQSINESPLGRIGFKLDLSSRRKQRSKAQPILNTKHDASVTMLMIHPGMKVETIEKIGQSYKGLILLGYGVGNLPNTEPSVIPVIEALVKQGTAVVIGTQCTVGGADMDIYDISNQSKKVGAFSARDMTPETALVKLMWVLGQTSDARTIQSMMLKNFVGELSTPKD